jgi:hypothetical protein
MTTFFLICAIVGGTVLVCQFVMTVIGLGGHHDFGDGHVEVPHDVGHDFGEDAGHAEADGHDGEDGHDNSTWFFKIITFRTIVAAVTFFGLTGMAANASGLDPWQTIAAAIGAGAAAMFGVHWLMLQIERLNADGTVRINESVGMTGIVYLKVPGRNAGAGKIQINLQDRTVELQAFTSGEEIPTGANVVVLSVVGPDSVAVERAVTSQKVGHA